MRRLPLLVLLALVSSKILLACVGDDPALLVPADGGPSEGGPAEDSAPADAGSDAPPSDGGTDGDGAACNPTAQFGAPVPVTELNTGNLEESISLSADELTAYFIRDKSLYTATRVAKEGAFGAASIVANANQDGTTHNVAVTHDGQVLYTVSTIESGPKVFFSASNGGGYGTPAKVSGPSGDFFGSNPYLNIQKSNVYYSFPTVRDGGGPNDALYMATIAAPGAWTSPKVIEELFSNKGDRSPVLSADQRSLYFASRRDGEENIYVSTRASIAAQWGTPVVIPAISTFANDAPSWISDDSCRLYVVSMSSGNSDIYLAKRGF
ncbi:MAG TPA: hypothetical protein VLT33_08950 [Labilithrix sp.]|nr:hypothetical protein [Labilithrix sp.]